MSTLTAPIRCTSLPLWRILTCLLLAGLFLYNPFLAAYPAAGNIAVCHPASYRATVGSSELEQFAQPAANPVEALPVRNAVQVLILESANPDAGSRRYIELEVVVIPQTGFSSSLWFRPPPAI
jgi:hypothetical protein